jgi:hypothetical protein
MGIDLNEGYNELSRHVNHDIEIVFYGDKANVAVECLDCGEVLLDFDHPDFTHAESTHAVGGSYGPAQGGQAAAAEADTDTATDEP